MNRDSKVVEYSQQWRAILISLLWHKCLSAIYEWPLTQNTSELRNLIAEQCPELRNAVDLIPDMKPVINAEAFDRLLFSLPSLSDESFADHLLTIVKAPHSDLLWEAIFLLGKLRENCAVKPLIALLKDKRVLICIAAIRALGRIGDRRAVKPLNLLLEDKRDDIRWGSINALFLLKDRRSIKSFVNALHDSCFIVRHYALKSLNRFDNLQVLDLLLPVLINPPSAWMEEVINFTLRRTNTERAVEPLITRINSDKYNIRYHSALALGKIGDHRAVEPLFALLARPDCDIVPQVIDALVQLKMSQTTKRFLSLLTSENSDIRRCAARALGQLYEQEAIAPLTTLLDDPDIFVQEAADDALKRLKIPYLTI